MDAVLPFETFAVYFSNFSGHSLEYKGVMYRTPEHAYHCQRYADADVLREIAAAPSAFKAWQVSQQYKRNQHADFEEDKVRVMKEILWAKVKQHEDVRRALIDSGESEIIKNHPQDYFWGNGADGTGRNEMGKLWMEIRKELKEGNSVFESPGV